ncbi:quinone oxidoreductase-like protein 2-like [Heracleum sosnowskyi]|uniref:Quinone oxidoreductase-like protein 2-like n=1 Tax=Heracleum sosnowskyi TaxID=360622 RepID=A0AAD8JAW5_9APIA|nr:quinone oxidoreductase-like protein 2-like [Heracleum sosnowskyi]
MEALVCRNLGDPTIPPDSSPGSPLTVSKAHPIPALSSPTSVRVRVRANTLNFPTMLRVEGKYQEKEPLPFVLGSDYSGVVESVGVDVSNLEVGDRVCGVAELDSFAQFIVVDQTDLFRVPDGCDLVAAAALPIAFGTSYSSLIHRAQLHSGQVLLVLGAAGGVGLAAVQIGKIRGATVIAVARGIEKVNLLKSIGADHVVDLNKGNITASIKEFLQSRKLKGVDILYDPVGGKLTKESLRLLNWGAQILVIGFASGQVPLIPANIALVKNWTVHGFYYRKYNDVVRPGAAEDSMKDLLSWLAKGLLTVHTSHVYSLPEVNLGFAALRERNGIGKVVIVFDDPQIVCSKL